MPSFSSPQGIRAWRRLSSPRFCVRGPVPVTACRTGSNADPASSPQIAAASRAVTSTRSSQQKVQPARQASEFNRSRPPGTLWKYPRHSDSDTDSATVWAAIRISRFAASLSAARASSSDGVTRSRTRSPIAFSCPLMTGLRAALYALGRLRLSRVLTPLQPFPPPSVVVRRPLLQLLVDSADLLYHIGEHLRVFVPEPLEVGRVETGDRHLQLAHGLDIRRVLVRRHHRAAEQGPALQPV